MAKTLKVLYAGDSTKRVVSGMQGMRSFSLADEIRDAGVYLTGALEGGKIVVERILSHEAINRFPETAEDLAVYDVVILSDIAHDSLVLYPGKRKSRSPMGPNRPKEIVRYVENGGSLAYIGGYSTFQGLGGVGHWYDTPVARVLPVRILPLSDDRIETPEGVTPTDIVTDHDVTKGLDWTHPPIFNGYNRTGDVADDAILLARIGDDGHPLLVVSQVGNGRVLVFTSDCAPHWGAGFVRWPDYARFWQQAMRWLAASE